MKLPIAHSLCVCSVCVWFGMISVVIRVIVTAGKFDDGVLCNEIIYTVLLVTLELSKR